jgi:hypothetical protein
MLFIQMLIISHRELRNTQIRKYHEKSQDNTQIRVLTKNLFSEYPSYHDNQNCKRSLTHTLRQQKPEGIFDDRLLA